MIYFRCHAGAIRIELVYDTKCVIFGTLFRVTYLRHNDTPILRRNNFTDPEKDQKPKKMQIQIK